MPTKVKEMAEAKEKAAPEQAREKQPERPEKAAGVMLLFRAVTSPQPPPSPKQSADELLTNANSDLGASSRARTMMTLQRSVGNTRMNRTLGLPLQAQLAVSAPDDAYEKEADRVAEAVTNEKQEPDRKVTRISRLPASSLAASVNRAAVEEKAEPQEVIQTGRQVPPEAEQEGKVQTQTPLPPPPEIKAENTISRAASDTSSNSGAVDAGMESRIKSPSGGRPLPEGLRRDMETGLGHDFSNVRVHDSAEDQADASRVNAKAFTHGQDIWLGSGASVSDRKLMAHELTHVVQQTGGIQRKVAQDSEQQSDVTSKPPSAPQQPAQEMPQQELPAKQPADKGEDLQDSFGDRPDEGNEPTEGDAATDADAIDPQEQEGDGAVSPEMDAEMATMDSPEPPTASGGAGLPAAEPPAGELTGQMKAEVPVTRAGAASTLPTSIAHPEAASPQPGASLVQRDEDEDDGILAGIRRRISGIVDGLRSGWSHLSQMGQGAFDGLSGQASGLVRGLSGLVATAISVVQGAWSGLARRATQFANGIKRQFHSAVSTVNGAVQAIGQAIIRLDANALRAAWGRLVGLIGVIWQRLQQAGQTAFRFIAGLWQGLRNRFTGVLSNLTNRARDMFNRLRSAAERLRQRLASAWEALRSRASQMSGVLGSILAALRALVSRLISWGQQIWAGIQEQWSALRDRIGGLLQRLQQRVAAAWQGLRQRAQGLWSRVQSLWGRLRQWIGRQMQRLVNGIRSIWNRFQSFSIESLINKIATYAPFIRAVEQVVQDPDAAMAPIVDAIAGKLEAEMPPKAMEIGRQRIQEQGGVRIGGTTTAKSSLEQTMAAQSASGVVIQQQPNTELIQRASRSTASLEEIGNGIDRHISHKWAQVRIWQMVKDMLWSLLWPWPAIGHELSELWNTDLSNAVNSLFVTRNLFSDPLGFLHDLWTNILHLLDIPLAIWRRINNILLLLMGWITLFLVLIGAFFPAVAGAVIGAILSALGSLGIATPAGAGIGAGAGGAVGAGVGFTVALLLGEVFLGSFALAEGLSVSKALVDLFTGRQTAEEKERDYSQIADSLIALGVTAVLVAIGWIASKLASAILNFVREIRAPRADPPRGEPGRGEPPRERPPGEEPPGEEPPGEEPPGEEPPGEEPPSDIEVNNEDQHAGDLEETPDLPGDKDIDPGVCFPVGTLVSTTKGLRPIEDICAGDLVYALNLNSQTIVTRRVLGLVRGATRRWVDVYVGQEKSRATPSHLFWVESIQNWVRAEDLAVNSKLRLQDGELAEVSRIECHLTEEKENTFNLSVEDAENYFIGSLRVLVHNIKASRLVRLQRPGFRNYVLRAGGPNGKIYYSGMFGPNQTVASVKSRHRNNHNRFNEANGDFFDLQPGTREYGESRLMEHQLAVENETIIGKNGSNYRGNRQKPIAENKMPEYLEYEQFKQGCG